MSILNESTSSIIKNKDWGKNPKVERPRSTFRRDSTLLTTMMAGNLCPIFVDEVLPGDTHTLNIAALGRLANTVHPFMDDLQLDTFAFFVPSRLLWDDFERMHGERRNPTDDNNYTVPQVHIPSTQNSMSLTDYFGIPTNFTGKVNALPYRAYNLIYNEFFRDENLQDSVPIYTGNEDRSVIEFKLKKRGKRHDMFTSCLPWPQKGDAISLPLGDKAPVEATGPIRFINNNGQSKQSIANMDWNQNIGLDLISYQGGSWSTNDLARYYDGLQVDLSGATSATINKIREAFQLQRLLERDARGGTRYAEIIYSHFGVVSPDARLQRPEFLGAGRTQITTQQIPQTSSTTSNSEQGNLAGISMLTSSNAGGFNKSFTEHGHIIVLACLSSRPTYQKKLERMWTRKTRFDHYYPTLAHLGEQPVFCQELYYNGIDDDYNKSVFGYIPRWDEYRGKNNAITGDLNSYTNSGLDIWHLAPKYDDSNPPKLNATFIEDNPPMQRIKAVNTAPDLMLSCYFELKSARPMPVYAIPGNIDRF